MPAYLKRVVDEALARHLRLMPAVILQGPKGCGKTTSAAQLCASKAILDAGHGATLARTDPALVLPGATPRLLDEWQVFPDLWNLVRHEVDRRNQSGQFILAGSARPVDDVGRHSGAGRFATVTMRTMSLYESGHSSHDVSFSALLAGDSVAPNVAPSDVAGVVGMLCRSGFPRAVGHTTEDALAMMTSYVTAIGSDAAGLGVRRDPARVRSLLTALAKHVSTDATIAQLSRASVFEAGETLSLPTVRAYLKDLTRMMVIEPQPAWGPHLRSKARVRQAPKWTWTDPALAVAALHAGPQALLNDVGFLGLLFENLVVRDLRVYSESHGALVSHYRDSNGLEVDAIVSTPTGAWLACEIKLGSSDVVVDSAAANLTRFVDTVDTSRVGAPAGLVVITASGAAYTRPDGVRVVPITTLGP